MTQRDSQSDNRVKAQILSMVASRDGGTVCPSEVSRKLAMQDDGADEWRKYMDAGHAAVDDLKVNGKIELSWKRIPLNHRAGPYRISTPLKDRDRK